MTSSPSEKAATPWSLAALPDREQWVRWLASDLLEDAAARLEHSGGGSATTIALAKVFVDVAAGTGAGREEEIDSGEVVEAPDIESTPPPEPGLLAELLSTVPRPAGREVIAVSGETGSRVARTGQEPGRVLVLGGPGQGKSTLVQQLCQLHRAALLAPVRDELLPAARNTLDLLLATHATEQLPTPEVPCWPLRVILRDFAAWLPRDNGDLRTALPRFMVRRLKDMKSPLSAERLDAMLSERPWLLVLDGLDEVPVSGGRVRMLEAIRAWTVGPAASSPHLIISTTRPQGYAGELGYFVARPLSDLSRTRAFRYASLLVEARHPNQPVRQREVLERLAHAWGEPASRRLLRTPLQVSMMAALVGEVGRPPVDRYHLFSEYYRLMYRRELERPNLSQAELLRDLRKPIDEVHRLAGFWLQARSEWAEGTEALLAKDELEQLVHFVLQVRFGYEDETERAQWVARIFEAAIERLVLLVHVKQDRYGFEIRSLQELMAAEALVNGEDAIVKERLRHVAPIDAWRNVVLFAAGECFANRDHLGAFVVHDLCPWLNDGMDEPSVRGTLTGSELALDLLEDGAARRQRQVEKPLAVLAFRLLEQTPNPIHRRLARIGEKELRDAFQQAIERKLASEEKLSAWATLLALVDNHAWAAGLAAKHWPADAESRRGAVDAAMTAEVPLGLWVHSRIAEAFESFPPSFVREVVGYGGPGLLPEMLEPVPLDAQSLHGAGTRRVKIVLNGVEAGVGFTFVPAISAIYQNTELARWANCPPEWRPFVEAARFSMVPSTEALAAALRAISEHWSDDTVVSGLHRVLPWPMGLALRTSSSAEELRSLADRIEKSELGEVATWTVAEEEWAAAPIDLSRVFGATSFWPSASCPTTVPWPGVTWWYGRPSVPAFLLPQVVGHYRASGPLQREVLAHVLCHLFFHLPVGLEARGLVSADELGEVVRFGGASSLHMPFRALRLVPDDEEDRKAQDWPSAIDTLGQVASWGVGRSASAAEVSRLCALYVKAPERLGLLRLLAIGLPYVESIPEVTSVLEQISRSRFAIGSPAHFHASLISIEDTSRNDDFDSLAASIAGSVPRDINEAAIADRWLTRRAPAGLLHRLVARLPPHAWSLSTLAIEGLRAWRLWRDSDLESPATCQRLRLPPPPSRHSPADSPSVQQIPWTPITTVSLTNLRPFVSTTFDLPIPPPSAGQWTVLVGENGVGKSTVLRALALALADGSAAAGALAKSEAPYRGDGTSPAKIEVRTKDRDRVFSATIDLDREAGRETLSRKPKNGGHRPFVVAYGCHRGSALGDPTRGSSFAAESDIATLFDETRGLAPAEGWLTKLKLGAKEDPDGRGGALYRTVERVLLKVLGIEEIDVQPDTVWVRSKATGKARLAALSDGYLTTAGWVVDMIARWIHREERLGREVAGALNETMEGLVLLDEVDLHLHPRWQRRVLRDLKALFPKLSFVITTHQPLTLLGADPGEVFVLRRDTAGAIDVQQIDLPKGLRADQVLTGEWFGLSTTLDPDTLGLLDEHRRLLRRGAPEEDPRRRDVEATLRARLGGFADTPIERLVRTVAAELLDEQDAEPDRAEALAEARERVTRVARERLERRKRSPGTRG